MSLNKQQLTVIEDSEGTPWGVYSASYYRAHGSLIRENASCDSNLTEAGARAAAARLSPEEIMRARCQNQPGGFTAFGSERAKLAWEAHQRAEQVEQEREAARRREAAIACEWQLTAADASGVSFTTTDKADGHVTKHSVLWIDLRRFAADPSSAAEGWRDLPWGAILRASEERKED